MAKLSEKRILELLGDPAFQLAVAEYPDDHRDEIDQINDYVRATIPAATDTVNATTPAAFSVIGQRQRRFEDPARITGQAMYTADVTLPEMLWTYIVRSPHAHALIQDIDTSDAEKLPGVRAILSYKNAPATKLGGPPDQFLMQQEVHSSGEEVAVVAADDYETAREGAALIKVSYKVLPSITDIEGALKPDAPDIVGTKNNNKVTSVTKPVTRGDFDKAYASAKVTHQGRYTTSTLQHMYLEPRSAVARWEGPDRLVVWCSTQFVPGVRSELASYFGLPQSHVRAICENMGGGFGGKTGAARQGRIAAVLAKMTQRPVRVYYDRPTDMQSGSHRYADILTFKAGVDANGKLVAYSASNIGDAGAYNTGASALTPIQRLYHVENARFEYQGVITNRGPSGSLRCVGDPQGTWCQEIFIDELAEKAGIDPVQFRLQNFETKAYQDSGLPWASCGIVECVQKAASTIGWSTKWHKPAAKINGRTAHGIGVAAHSCSHGAMSLAMSSVVRMDQTGAVDVNNGLTEIGGGQSTAMTMIACETIGAKFADSSAGWGDTSLVTDTGGTWGSRGTISAGSPTRVAALDLKAQLIKTATAPRANNKPLLDAQPEDCDTADGYVFLKSDPTKKVAMKDVVNSTGSPMIGRGTYVVPSGYQQGVFSAGIAEVEVDLDTGEVTLLRYVFSNDVGKAINVLGVEQQMEGAAVLSMGFGLGEETRYDPPNNFAVNWSYENYPVPTVLETPKWADFRPIIVEPLDALGPYGAKGVGEPPTSPPAPAIANAVYNAIGVRIHDAPLTRDKILAAIAQMK